MAKLFVQECSCNTTSQPTQSYINDAPDDEMVTIIEADADTIEPQMHDMEDASDAINDGMTTSVALEKLAHMAKSALVGPNKGFTPGEAEAINFGLEAISTMIGASKPLILLKSTNFSTESLSTRYTGELAMSQEGLKDVMVSVAKAIDGSFTRLITSLKRFWLFIVKLRGKQEAIAKTLLDRLSTAKADGRTIPGKGLGGKALAQVRHADKSTNIEILLKQRTAVLMDIINNALGMDMNALKQMVDAESTADMYPILVNDLILPRIDGYKNTSIGDFPDQKVRAHGAEWQAMAHQVISIDGKRPILAYYGPVVALSKGYNKDKANEMIVDKGITRFVKYAFTEGKLEGAKLGNSDGFDIETMQTWLGLMDMFKKGNGSELLNEMQKMPKILNNISKSIATQAEATKHRIGVDGVQAKMLITGATADYVAYTTEIVIPAINMVLRDNARILSACFTSLSALTKPTE